MNGQIDIEDAIAAVGGSSRTVSAFAEQAGWPEWRVRRAIAEGFIEVDRSTRPMLVIGGDMPLSTQEWQASLAPAVRKIRPTVCSWGAGGRELHVLCIDATVKVFKHAALKIVADQQRRQIDALDCRRLEG